jgi:NAD(P)H dehydrogenase (quinone)
MSRIAIVYHSGYGHTAVLAEKVAEGVRQAGASAALLRVDGAGQDFAPLLAEIDQADAVVFGSPTYMGDISAAFKSFEESTTAIFAAQGWRGKLAAGFTNSGSASGDKLHALESLSLFAAQHGMVWVNPGQRPGGEAQDFSENGVNRLGAWLGVIAQSANAPAEVTPPAGDRETARLLGVRVAEAARRWGREPARQAEDRAAA